MTALGYDFSQVPDDSVDDFLEQGQESLSGTVQLGIASDQRATAISGIFGAISLALLAAFIAIMTSANPNYQLAYACLGTATGLLIASFICAWAARPIDFYVSGYEPRHLAKATGDLNWMKRYAAEDVQRRIDFNSQALQSASRKINAAALIAFCSPILGLLGLLISRHLS